MVLDCCTAVVLPLVRRTLDQHGMEFFFPMLTDQYAVVSPCHSQSKKGELNKLYRCIAIVTRYAPFAFLLCDSARAFRYFWKEDEIDERLAYERQTSSLSCRWSQSRPRDDSPNLDQTPYYRDSFGTWLTSCRYQASKADYHNSCRFLPKTLAWRRARTCFDSGFS